MSLSLALSLPGWAAELIPMGQAVGIEAKTEGLLVTGFCDIETPEGTVSPAKDGGLREGDVIVSVGDTPVRTAEDLTAALQKVERRVTVTVARAGTEKSFYVTPWRSEDGARQIGVWLRDGISGIGTVTYCDPATGAYGALGHGITDENGKSLLPLDRGEIVRAEISGARRGGEGEAGELMGSFASAEPFGSVEENTVFGIFGKLSEIPSLAAVETASDEEVHTGEAVIRATLEGQETRDYAVTVDRIYREQGCTRFLLTVTDPALLERLAGRFPGRIAVGVDVRGDRVATRGWLKDSGVTLAELCTRLQQLGITGVIVTDIARDGAMGGSNCELYRKMREEFPALQVTASGGVSSHGDLQALRGAGCWGAIVGKAYYTGAVDLRRAIEENT